MFAGDELLIQIGFLMPTQVRVFLWGEWGITRIQRRVILQWRCQFAAPPNYGIFQNALHTSSPQATLSGTPFSSSAINLTYLLDSFLRIHSGDT
jgi:hypothetical protein